jgi:hypothetical protein
MTQTEATMDVLIVTDQAGDCYLLDRAVLDKARVPAAHRAAVEQALTTQADVSGFITPIPIPDVHTFQLVGSFTLPTSLLRTFGTGTLGFDPGGGLGVAG